MKLLIQNARLLLKNPVFFGTVIVTLGIFAGSILSYILQFILAHFLSLAEYGTFNAFLSIYNIVGVFAIVFSTALIKLVAELKAQGAFDKLTVLFLELSGFSFVINILLFIIFFLFRNFFARILNISDAELFIPFGLFIGISLLFMVPSAFLQGLLRFKAFSFYTFTSALLRLTFPVILILTGYKVGGVFFGIFLSMLCSFIISLPILKKNFVFGGKYILSGYYKKLFLFSIPVFLVNISMTMFNNIDIVLVKKFLTEDTAGLYSLVVTAGKILLFGSSTIAIVMYPQIAELYAKKEDYTKKFRQFLLLQFFVVFTGFVILYLFPIVIKIFFGQIFISAIAFVPRYSMFIALYVLINFFTLFLLAINRTSIYLFHIPVVFAQVLLINAFHQDLYQIINVNIFVSTVLLIGIVLYTVSNAGINNNSCIQAGSND